MVNKTKQDNSSTPIPQGQGHSSWSVACHKNMKIRVWSHKAHKRHQVQRVASAFPRPRGRDWQIFGAPLLTPGYPPPLYPSCIHLSCSQSWPSSELSLLALALAPALDHSRGRELLVLVSQPHYCGSTICKLKWHKVVFNKYLVNERIKERDNM